MKEEREFLKQLNRNRFDKIPFLEYFQKDKYLRKLLFDIHKQNKQPFFDIKLFKSLNEIDKEIKDFKNLVLNEIKFNSLIYSESFVKNIIYKLEIIQIPKLTKSILNNFVDEVENVELLAAYITEDNDHSFENQYDISFKEAERKYRELKRFADNYFIYYLKEKINKFKDHNVNGLSINYLAKKQNELIPSVSVKEVLTHFETLTEKTNKKGEFYLTEEQLIIFINSTFIQLEPIKQKFNCNGFIKKNIRKIFYDFYFKNKNKEYNQTALKRKYFNIMDDAFEGFNSNDYTDFAK